jgi:hypothetical protein
VDTAVAKINAQMPDPNNTDVGDGLNTAGFRFNTPSNSFEDQYTFKVDHNVTSTNRAFFRFSRQRNSSIDTLNNAERTYPGQIDGTQGGTRWGYAVGDDWTIRPNLINEFRIGYQKADTAFLRPNRPKGPAYITSLVTDVQYAGFPQGRYSPVIDVTENLTWIKSKHVIKAGTNIRRTLQYGWDEFGTQPDVRSQVANGATVPTTIGPASLTAAQRSVFEQLYNDILGRVDRVASTFYSDLTKFQAAGAPRVRNYMLREGGFFVQDDWKISRKLTLNVGMRWEFYLKPTERDTLQGRLDGAETINGVTPNTNLTMQRSNDWVSTDFNNFAPRFGFAYDLMGDGRTAIRGSYGIFYDRMMGSVTSGIDSNTPGFASTLYAYPNQTSTPASDVRLADNPAGPATPAAPTLNYPATRSTNIRILNPNLRTGYVQNYSLNVQRELIRNTVLDVGYVGNRGVKLLMLRDLNQPKVTPELLADFKTIAAFVGNSATAVPASNVFVRLYGTAAAAATALGASNFTQGRLGTVLNSLDTNSSNFNRYAAAGLPSTYLRLYPQFLGMQVGTNDGRSYYDSLQISIRRNTGALRTSFNYTLSHALDNVGAYSTTSSSQEGNGFATPIDNYNVRLMRGTADFDRRHAFNSTASYTLPVGKGRRFGANMGRIANMLIGGWDIGALTVWQSGAPFTVLSQRATGAFTNNTWANYSGSKSVGSVERRGDGVYFLTAADFANFGFPGPGEVGTSGRNTFRQPRFFNLDASLVKKFKITEGHSVGFRAEAYNAFNNANFSTLTVNLNNPASQFGKLGSTVGAQGTSARVLQLSLRYDF